MKKFNRVLAMLLALITVVAMLPISAIADTWLDVEAEKEQTGNVTTSDVTVTVDPYALLAYLQDGDWVGLLKGMSASGGLGSIVTREELFDIIPKDQLVELVAAVLEDVDTDELLDCFDIGEVLTCFDREALIDLFMGLGNLPAYVRNYDLLMSYISNEDIEAAISYVNAAALFEDYSAELIALAIEELEPSDWMNVVDLEAIVNVVDFATVANQEYFENVITALIEDGADLADFVNVDAIKADIAELTYEEILPYINEANAQLIYKAQLGSTLGQYTKYWAQWNGGADIMDPVNILKLDVVYAEDLLANQNEVLFDGCTVGENEYASAINLTEVLFGEDKLLDFNTLIAEGYVDVAALVAEYGADLFVAEELEAQLSNADAAEVANCVDVVAILNIVGVVDAVNAIGSYNTVLNSTYVNMDGFVHSFDLDAIANEIISDRAINDVFYVVDLIEAAGAKNIARLVQFKKLGKLIYESGAIEKLAGMLDIKEYLVKAFGILTTAQKNITEIKINGVAITVQEDGYIKLVPSRVIDALENLVPSLGELANLDDSGKLLGATLEFSYYADETGDVINTKVINFNFVLTAGTGMIRRAAAKLAAVLDKVGYVDLVGGELVAEITIPSEFATVLRKALEKLADSSDPKMNAIKDKVLNAYNANPDDFIAFAQGLTFEEVMAVLDAIDPAFFGEVYNKALASRYAQVLLAYVEERTGYDLSDNLEVQYFVTAISEIPTFRDFVLTLEEITEIEILYLLPETVNGYLDHDAYEVIEKLGDVFGYEFDISNLLKAAAASADPFGYLYTAVINKVENFGGAYAFIQRNAIRVVNRLMHTRFGAAIADNCILDFYKGNSTFKFEDDIHFDAKQVLKNDINRLLGVISGRVPTLAAAIEEYLDLDFFLSDSSNMHAGFDVTIHVNGIYSVEFVNEYGASISTLLLPVGADLSKMVNYYADVDAFNGWVDVATGEYVTVVPNKDVVLKADIQGFDDRTVTVVVKNGETVLGTQTLVVKDGATLDTYKATLDEMVVELYPNDLTNDQVILGYAYTHSFNENEWPATVEENITIEANVVLNQVNDPVNSNNDYTLELTETACIVTFEKNWNEYANGISINFNKAFIAALAEGRDLILTAKGENAQKVTVNAKALAQLASEAGVNTIGFTYDKGTNTYAENSGAESYDISFNYDGVAIKNLTFTEGAVEITLPYANGIISETVKTFVDADGDPVEITVADGMVSFVAPHFSTFTIVNKYKVDYSEEEYAIENAKADDYLPTVGANVANFNKENLTGWYAEGDIIEGKFVAYDKLGTFGLAYEKTMFNDTEFDGKFVMPGEAVIITHYVTAETFYVYYYVNGVQRNDLTKEHNILMKNTLKVETITGVKPSADVEDGWYWYDQESVAAKIGKEDIHLYWVNDSETEITVNFIIDEAIVYTETNSITAWRNGALAGLQSTISVEAPGYTWKSDYAALENYTVADLIAAGDTVNFYGTARNLTYHVFTDGNAYVDIADAKAGVTITIGRVIARKGYDATLSVYETEDGTTYGNKVELNADNTFVMPYSDVLVVVTYTPVVDEYAEISFTIPAGSTLNANDITSLKSAPEEIVLVDAERGANGDLVLTYRYKVTENFNEKAFRNAVNALIAKAQYATTTYIVDGKIYNNEKDALANLPEGATFMGWIEMSNNVKVAFLEFAETESNTTWIIVCIVLVVLLVIAIIALIYILHISDRMDSSWITKVCTAIVTGFFAFCMFVANVTLKLLKLLGIKKEDIIEELPTEPVEDIPAVLINPEAEVAAEEAVVEEVVAQEAVEEVVEEVVEDAPILDAEVITEEATEETTEEN